MATNEKTPAKASASDKQPEAHVIGYVIARRDHVDAMPVYWIGNGWHTWSRRLDRAVRFARESDCAIIATNIGATDVSFEPVHG